VGERFFKIKPMNKNPCLRKGWYSKILRPPSK
jgi:hypothetical protein